VLILKFGVYSLGFMVKDSQLSVYSVGLGYCLQGVGFRV